LARIEGKFQAAGEAKLDIDELFRPSGAADAWQREGRMQLPVFSLPARAGGMLEGR
jgi:hypothetical protein